jgi:hypothetical protein
MVIVRFRNFPQERNIVLMGCGEQMDLPNIPATTGLSVPTLKTHLCRAEGRDFRLNCGVTIVVLSSSELKYNPQGEISSLSRA